MQCCLCQKVALYKVNQDGYCKDHYQNAVERRKQWALQYERYQAQHGHRGKSRDSRFNRYMDARQAERQRRSITAAKALGERGHGTRDPLDGAVKESKK